MTVQNSTFAATVGGAITAIAMWVIKTWGQTEVPPEIATAVTTIIMAVITHLVPDAAPAAAPPANVKPAE